MEINNEKLQEFTNSFKDFMSTICGVYYNDEIEMLFIIRPKDDEMCVKFSSPEIILSAEEIQINDNEFYSRKKDVVFNFKTKKFHPLDSDLKTDQIEYKKLLSKKKYTTRREMVCDTLGLFILEERLRFFDFINSSLKKLRDIDSYDLLVQKFIKKLSTLPPPTINSDGTKKIVFPKSILLFNNKYRFISYFSKKEDNDNINSKEEKWIQEKIVLFKKTILQEEKSK